jgi:hypothetical protein
MSAYAGAIDLTTRIVEIRARYFRNQVILVVTASGALIASAAVMRYPLALLGLLFLIPACGGFFFVDSRLLQQWRVEVFASWVKRDLDFFALRNAIRAIPSLPKETLDGMLLTLPQVRTLIEEQDMSAATRAAVACAAQAFYRQSSQSMLVCAGASATAVSSIVAAVSLHQWALLVGLGTVGIAPAARAVIRFRTVAKCREAVNNFRSSVEFNESDYARLLAGLPWGGNLLRAL